LWAPFGAERGAFDVEAGKHERPMSSQVELCEHHAKDCLQAAERTEDPLAREMLLRHALEWMRDGLAASKQSKLCAVCGRKAAPGSSLVH
jgi:hypothetical protein